MRMRCEFCGSSKLKVYKLSDFIGGFTVSSDGFCEHAGKSITYTAHIIPNKSASHFVIAKCLACKHLQIIERDDV